VFENVVTITAIALKLAIPDISAELKYKIRREAYITKEIIIRTERLRAASGLWAGRAVAGSHQEISPPNRGAELAAGRRASTGDVTLLVEPEPGG